MIRFFVKNIVLKAIMLHLFLSLSAQASEAGLFRFHITNDPQNLHPHRVDTASGQYLMSNLYRGLMKYDNDKGLVPDLAESCSMPSPQLARCRLRSNLKYSGDQTILPNDYLNSFHQLINPKNITHGTENFTNLKNFEEVLSGNKLSKDLGVKVKGQTIEFHLTNPDPDFLYRLTSPQISPLPQEYTSEALPTQFATGPYKLKEWKRNESLHLAVNTHHPLGRADRPDVLIRIIGDDVTALRLYETGRLDLLRRVPTEHLHVYKDHEELFFLPMLRMDYIGIAGSLKDNKGLRKAIAQSLDFKEFQDIFHAKGAPGCFGLPESIIGTEAPCLEFKPKESKKLVTESDKKKRLKLFYSTMGGDDILRAVQWFQGQWRKHLNLTIDLDPHEQVMLTSVLSTKPPDLFRRGVPIDRPTCLAALEIFQKDSPDNFIRVDNSQLEAAIKRLQTKSLSKSNSLKACQEGLKALLKEYRLIPLGEIHFSMLRKPNFSGWSLNRLNQLDLSDLHPVSD